MFNINGKKFQVKVIDYNYINLMQNLKKYANNFFD